MDGLLPPVGGGVGVGAQLEEGVADLQLPRLGRQVERRLLRLEGGERGVREVGEDGGAVSFGGKK